MVRETPQESLGFSPYDVIFGHTVHGQIKGQISDTNYVVQTPDQNRKSRVRHINMLKRYFSRDGNPQLSPPAPMCAAARPQYQLGGR